jgi:hypothetical protein
MQLHGRHSNPQLLRMLGDALRKESARWSAVTAYPTASPAQQKQGKTVSLAFSTFSFY